MLRRKFNRSFFKRFASFQASLKTDQNENTSPNSHIFKKKLFVTHAELAENLEKNSIFNKNGLIILNKPYGLKKEQKEHHNFTKFTLPPSVSYIDHLSFTGALPRLAECFLVDHLDLVKLPDRYSSGVSILSSKEAVTKKIAKCLRNNSITPYTYLVLCVGIPKESENSTTLGVTLTEKHEQRRIMFVKTWSKTASLKRKVHALNIQHRVLSVNEEFNVSLVQLVVNDNMWNCLRLYCVTNLFSPCLGDELMTSRLKYVNGVPVVIDPFSSAANAPTRLPDKILDVLRIKKFDVKSIPLHSHLAQLDLPGYGRNGIKFVAKPPEHFLWSCEQLGISIPETYSENCSLPFKQPKPENAVM